MVQPYLSAVDEMARRRSLFFDGEFSHAIRKGPLLAPRSAPSGALFVKEDITARRPRAEELGFAETILDALPWRREELLYARVDLIPGRGRDAPADRA